jgi:hypothetical protein
MADRVLFIGWNRAVVGRERQAMQLFQKAVEFYGELQADGRIESFEPVLLSAHGGDLNGFFLLRGEAEKIGELQRDKTFADLTLEAGYCLEGVGVIPGFIGEGLTDVFSRWSKLVGGQ